jgi:hypothetical protein
MRTEKRILDSRRGPWSQWRKPLARDFGVQLPVQPENVGAAYELRKFAAHRGGFMQFSEVGADTITVDSPATPDDIRGVTDELLLIAAEVAFAGMRSTAGVQRSDQWTRLSNFRYELLTRRRYEVCARSTNLDPQGNATWR